MRRTLRLARRLALVMVPVTVLVSGVTTADAGQPFETVVTGLRNPRGLDLSANGRLYVAESGEAGPVCFEGIPTEEGGQLCGGRSGRISRIDTRSGARTDFITGLASIGGPLFAIGPSGLAVQGNQVYALMGANDVALPPADACGGGADCRAFLATAQAQLGHLLRGVTSGRWAWRQDLGRSNFQWTVDNKSTIGAGDPSYQPGWADNPDFQPGDANPYGMTNAPGGMYTVDGGSNTLTWVPHEGRPRVIAAFPNPDPSHANAYDAVPTCVTTSRGKVFVADLNGRVFVMDDSSLTVKPSAVTSQDGAFLVAAGGCAADGKGNVYVSDIFAGSVVKVSMRTMAMSWVRPPGTLNFPAGVALARDGSLYIANNSVCPSFPTPVAPDNPCGGVTGSVVRLHP